MATMSPTEQKVIGNVVLVEDEEMLREAYERILAPVGVTVMPFESAEAALDCISSQQVDAIVCDINLPGISGTDLLLEVRKRGLDVPVILISGSPSVQSAASAVEFGAMRYLLKPVNSDELRDAVKTAVNLTRVTKLQREINGSDRTDSQRIMDLESAEARLASGLRELWMAYQPIVSNSRQAVVGHEALLRTAYSEIPHPGVFLQLAERTGRTRELGREIRLAIAKSAANRPDNTDIFVNLHPDDLLDPRLLSNDEPLLALASSVVLEVTERAAIRDVNGIRDSLVQLRKRGFRIAIDDIGSGFSGLNYLAMLEPDIVKLDMALIRGVHKDKIKQRLVMSVCTLCRDLGTTVVAEGIECKEEQDSVATLGCDLMQGYLYAKPGRPYPEASFVA
jgi:EAL domain-containing protein (putative c-di-GMP-specific phosphodiesterase class I)/CheY-like chemotaxis protein